MLVSEIQGRVKRQFGDESGVQIQDSDIINWINDAMRQFVVSNDGLFEKVDTLGVVPGTQEYALPVDLLLLQSISYKDTSDTAYRKLKGYSAAEFNEYIDGWSGTDVTGTPTCYQIFAKNIVLFPVPDHTKADAIKIYYNRIPALVSLPSDTPELPELYHQTIVKYCLTQAYELDEDWDAVGAKGSQIGGDLQLLKGRDEWKNQETYPVITVNLDDAW